MLNLSKHIFIPVSLSYLKIKCDFMQIRFLVKSRRAMKISLSINDVILAKHLFSDIDIFTKYN